MGLSKASMKDLADDFKSWGNRAINRIVSMTKKHGVLCSPSVFSDGKRG